MRKPYATPALLTQALQLGVFGDYGDDGSGTGVDTTPIKVIERLQMRMD